MIARMKSPALVLPNALKSLYALGAVVESGNVTASTLKFIDLRASQINGCGLCVDMHWRELKKMGQSDERIFAVAAWRDAPYFSDAERAALALTEAVTRLSDREDPVPDSVWDEAAKYYDETQLSAILLAIAKINVWNRLNVPTRQPSDAWKQLMSGKVASAAA